MESIPEDMYRLYSNTTYTILRKGLMHVQILVSQWGPETKPMARGPLYMIRKYNLSFYREAFLAF